MALIGIFALAICVTVLLLLEARIERKHTRPHRLPRAEEEWAWPPRWKATDKYVGPPGRERL